MRWLLFIPLVFITANVLAKDISAPPPLETEPAAEQHYFKDIYDKWGKLEVTTTNPNGNRLGKPGDTVVYKNGLLEYFFSLNIDGAYHWWAVEFKDIL